jgi:hypothetical protein
MSTGVMSTGEAVAAMAGAVFHVVLERGRWKVQCEGRCLGDHETQDQAARTARGRAHSERPSLVVIHGTDGRVEDEVAYYADP